MPQDNQHNPEDSSFSWEGILGVLHDVLQIKGQGNDSAEKIAEFLRARPELTERIVERLKLYFREGIESDGIIQFRALHTWGLICRAFGQSDGTWYAHTYDSPVYGHYGSSEHLDIVGNQFADFETAKQACLNHLKAIGYCRIHSDLKKEDS